MNHDVCRQTDVQYRVGVRVDTEYSIVFATFAGGKREGGGANSERKSSASCGSADANTRYEDDVEKRVDMVDMG